MNWVSEIYQKLNGQEQTGFQWMVLLWSIIRNTWMDFGGKYGIYVEERMSPGVFEVIVFKDGVFKFWCFTDGRIMRIGNKDMDCYIASSKDFETARRQCIDLMVEILK